MAAALWVIVAAAALARAAAAGEDLPGSHPDDPLFDEPPTYDIKVG